MEEVGLVLNSFSLVILLTFMMRCGLFKFNVWIKNVTLIEDLGKFFFTMCSYEEIIIYIYLNHTSGFSVVCFRRRYSR